MPGPGERDDQELVAAGAGITAYGVLSRGLISESLRSGSLGAIAAAKGINVAQLAIAWSLTRGDDIVPLIGTSNPAHLAEAIEATRIELTADELTAIEAAIPADAVAGERYSQAQMAILDSER